MVMLLLKCRGPEGSTVELAIRSGPETRFLSLTYSFALIPYIALRLSLFSSSLSYSGLLLFSGESGFL